VATAVRKPTSRTFGREGALENGFWVFQSGFSAKSPDPSAGRKKVPSGPILGGKKVRNRPTQVIIFLLFLGERMMREKMMRMSFSQKP
jgi:hypothetical protein